MPPEKLEPYVCFEGTHPLTDSGRRNSELRRRVRKVLVADADGQNTQGIKRRQGLSHGSFEGQLQMNVKTYRYGPDVRPDTLCLSSRHSGVGYVEASL